MTTEQELRRAHIMVHNAEKLARHALDPATFEFLAERFNSLIRELDELAQVGHILAGQTND